VSQKRVNRLSGTGGRHPVGDRVENQVPLSLKGIANRRDDNRPAFPGDPDMDWESKPERPSEPRWGLQQPVLK
jgi:hypothetical protein